MKILFLGGPGLGDRCDGGSDEETDGDSRRTSHSRSKSKSKSRRGRGKVRGAREREAYGELEEVELECQRDLVCVDVGGDRKKCQPENENGNCEITRSFSKC